MPSEERPAPDDLDLGTAGASARREHERRKDNREKRVRTKHPHIGGALLALKDEPTHETVWARGARGEERVAKVLAKHLSDDVVVLHDRRIPGSRANIDHIAVAPSGVWVIDSKRYKGKVAVTKPLFGEARLTIGGRNRTKLVEGLAKQVALVEVVMIQLAPDVPVRARSSTRSRWPSASVPAVPSPASKCGSFPPGWRATSQPRSERAEGMTTTAGDVTLSMTASKTRSGADCRGAASGSFFSCRLRRQCL
jgi:hypothetical protein